jgi:hypothetical protein
VLDGDGMFDKLVNGWVAGANEPANASSFLVALGGDGKSEHGSPTCELLDNTTVVTFTRFLVGQSREDVAGEVVDSGIATNVSGDWRVEFRKDDTYIVAETVSREGEVAVCLFRAVLRSLLDEGDSGRGITGGSLSAGGSVTHGRRVGSADELPRVVGTSPSLGESDQNHCGMIIGGVLGTILALGALGVCAMLWRTRKGAKLSTGRLVEWRVKSLEETIGAVFEEQHGDVELAAQIE